MGSHESRTPVGEGRDAKHTLFAIGFRPLFLCATAASVVLVLLWLWTFHNPNALQKYYQGVDWHIHEMLFGFTAAVIAGFLLTAVRNWTGTATLHGKPLALLCLLWFSGRLLPFLTPEVPFVVVAVVDLSFLPCLALSLAGPLMTARAPNRMFIVILILMTGANALVHAQALGFGDHLAMQGNTLMLNLVIILVAMIGGRVIPVFTRNTIDGFTPRTVKPVEIAAIALLVVGMLARQLDIPVSWIGWVSLTAAVFHGIRYAGWATIRVWNRPMLAILHAGYLWLVIGLLLEGLTALGWFWSSLSTHALTMGVIGSLTLGMMARVTMGHTGRPIQAGVSLSIAFVLLNVGTLVRVFGPISAPENYLVWVVLAGILWISAYAILGVRIIPMLLRPRVDGQPG